MKEFSLSAKVRAESKLAALALKIADVSDVD